MIKRLLLKLKNIKISRRNAKKVLAVLSAITVFSTTYALILPAITIDKDTAIDEPGLDVYNTEGDGKLVLSDSVPGDLTELVSRYGSCSDLSVGAALTDGVFDEGVQMEVTPISDESIINAAVDVANEQFREADKVRAVEISFKDENGSVQSPDAPLNLTLSGKAISEASDPVIVRIDNNGNAEEISGKEFADLVYLESENSSVYAIVETHELTTRYISADGSNYAISVEYDKDAQIPETAELKVSELDPNSKEYEECFYEAYGKLPAGKVIKEARFFDISIINDGQEIEPESEVSVKISYDQPLDLEDDNEVMSVHFTDSGAELNSNVETADAKRGGSVVSFNQSSFSVTGTLVTSTSNLHSGSTYVLVAENNGRYYAVGSNGANLPSQELSLTIDGSNVTINNRTALPNSCLWTYGTTNNGATLRNKNSNRYIVMSSSWIGTTMASMTSTPLTIAFGSNGKATIRNQNNYNLVLASGNGSFTRSNSTASQFYFIEYNTEGEYQVKFHYIDRDGNDIAPPEVKTMQYSESAVDLQTPEYIKSIDGYEFRVVRYGDVKGDRIRYIQNNKNSSSGEIIIYLKNEQMYASNSTNTPYTHTVNWGNGVQSVGYTDVMDTIDLTNRADHMIDIYVAYSEEGSPDPNKIIDQLDSSSSLPDEEFPFGAPDHNKRLEPNYTNGEWDGTYTLYIDVTGKAASVSDKTKADILLIYDTSNSMATRSGSQTRYQVAYNVVTNVAEELFANNSNDAPNDPTVRIAMVSFASTAKQRFGYVSNMSAFNTGFEFANQASTYDNDMYGATNWEDALQTSYTLWSSEHREDAKQYVVFISDGEPTCRASWCDWYDTRDSLEYVTTNGVPGTRKDATNGDKPFYQYGFGTLSDGAYYYKAVEHAYTNAKDDARVFVNAGVNFYTVGTFNTEESLQHMNHLANYAYSGFAYPEVKNKNYKYAVDATALHDVFSDIIHEITMDFGYGNVSIMDSMTAAALTTGDLIGHVSDFKYYKNPAGGTLTEWNGAPTATYNKDTKKVDWDLASVGMLEENTTYTLGFTVWPNQEAYDAIIDLNYQIDNVMTPEEVDAYGREHYPDVYPYLRKNSANHFIVQSNAEAELDYERFIVEDGGTPKSLGRETAGYSFPNMETTKHYLSVSKLWNDTLQDSNRFKSVVFEVYEDYDDSPGATNSTYATITLDASDQDPNDPYRWKKQIEISPGIIKTEINGDDPINEGHTYRVFEVGYTDKFGNFHDLHNGNDDYRYEFSQETVIPMLSDGSMILLNDADGDGELTGTNDLRGGINLYKETLGQDGNRIYTDDEYEFILHYTVPERFIIGEENGHPVYDPNAFPLWYTMYTDVDMDGDYFGENDVAGIPDTEEGWGTLDDGDHVKIKSNQMIRIINVPIGTDYSFEEINVPSGWNFDHANIEIDGEIVKAQNGPNSFGKYIINHSTVANAAHEVTFYNRLVHYEVKLHKVDKDNNTVVLPDAVFEIYSAPGKNPSDLLTINGKTRFTTDENGDVSLGIDLPADTYYMYEVTAPPGYRLLAEPIIVTVASGSITYSQPENDSGATQTATLTSGTNIPYYTIIAVNEPSGDLRIIKIDAEHPEVTLEGAVFNLYKLPEGEDEEDLIDPDTGVVDPEQLEVVTVSGETDLVSGADGSILIPGGLQFGTYFLFEITAPDGYVTAKYPVKITVLEDGQVVYIQKDYNAGQLQTAQPVESGGTTTLTVYVANGTGVMLPHTGGVGTWMYTTGGIMLVCIAVLTLCINLKRRRCERRNE